MLYLYMGAKERQAMELLQMMLKAEALFDTGNMAMYHINILDDHTIILGGENAKYTKFTLDHKDWANIAIEKWRPYAINLLQGYLSRDDYNKIYEQNKGVYMETIKRRIAEIKAKGI